ncbi:hypothetical protein D9M71_731780 [compost metagenome]
MAEGQQPRIAPDQIERQGDYGVAEDLAGQGQAVGGQMQRAVLRQQVQQRQHQQRYEGDDGHAEGDFRANLLRGGNS